MARENASEELHSPGVTAEKRPGIDITCPHCDSPLSCGEPSGTTCPDCEASYSVEFRGEFALVERGGWTVAVSIVAPDHRGVVGDG